MESYLDSLLRIFVYEKGPTEDILMILSKLVGKHDLDLNQVIRILACSPMTDTWYQIVGTVLGPNSKIQSDTLAKRVLEEFVPSPKYFWCLGNLLANYQIEVRDSLLVDKLKEHMDDPSCIRGLCHLSVRLKNPALFLESVTLEESDPKRLWTELNGLTLLADSVDEDLLAKMIGILGSTGHYKVAISCSQALYSVLSSQRQYQHTFADQIKKAILAQRFTINDTYVEMHAQQLKKANGDLLNLLDSIPNLSNFK